MIFLKINTNRNRHRNKRIKKNLGKERRRQKKDTLHMDKNGELRHEMR